ncbi:MAG: alpha-amylase family glycosyl hydrolase, partial [Flammeovirgaceae bacterium]|nr:alpha-amylase family glycosyl hydrolase [Flammeovirgaceae bacterium]
MYKQIFISFRAVMNYFYSIYRYLTIYCFVFLMQCQPTKDATAVLRLPIDKEWYKKAIFYEVFVQSFADSNGDGIGDLEGLRNRLDYLTELGITALWLMPIHPSPSYHKYDVTDYYDIHPDYGTKEDFKRLVNDAHQRGIRVVIDLVLNHTSAQHPWFEVSKKDKKNPFRDYYVWANYDSIAKEIQKKEITLDSDNLTQWHAPDGNKQADEYYYGFFWSGMPDLNYDNPKVRQEVFNIGAYWLTEMGVDGFRLDAAKHIFPDDRPEDNHAWWVEFRREMEKVRPDVFLLGEVWDKTEVVAPYLKGLTSVFNFDLALAIGNAALNGKHQNLPKEHQAILEAYYRVAPDFVDATFLTNHDQNRILSFLHNDENKMRMASALLFSLPGTPFIYYGEEIGMKGKKPDVYLREPFVWDNDEKDPMQPRWLEPTYSTETTVVPLRWQQQQPHSLYQHYKNWIKLRKTNPALLSGKIEDAGAKSHAIVAFYRIHPTQELLVLHNLSDKRCSLKMRDK